MLRRRGLQHLTKVASAVATWSMSALVAAQSDEDCVDFCWYAPAECPNEKEVQARVAALREGRDASEPRGIVARVTSDGQQWQLVLTQPPEPERRIIRADQCADLAEAAAVAITLSLGPGSSFSAPAQTTESTEARDAAARSDEPLLTDPAQSARTAPVLAEPATAKPTAALPVAPNVEPASDAAAPDVAGDESAATIDDSTSDSSDARRSILVGVDALFDALQLPSAAPGLRVAVGLRVNSLRTKLYAVGLLPVREEIPGAEGIDAQYGYLAAGVLGCAPLLGSPQWFRLCGSIEVGRLTAHADELVDAQEQRSIVPSVGLGVSAGRSWQDLELTVGIDAALALVRDRFTVDQGSTELFESPAVSVRGSVGLAFFIW